MLEGNVSRYPVGVEECSPKGITNQQAMTLRPGSGGPRLGAGSDIQGRCQSRRLPVRSVAERRGDGDRGGARRDTTRRYGAGA
jgi:hypothetical protein